MSETPASARGDSSAPAAQPKAQAGAKKRVRSRRALPLPLYYLATLLAGLGIWWIVAELFISKLLPTPADIAVTAVHLSANGTLGNDILASLRRVLIGFVIGSAVAIPFGFVMGWYRWARGFLEPWIQFFRAVPPLALIPFVVLALGIGEESKILIIALASFLATVVATAQGVTDVDRTLINAARVLGANDFTIFYHVLVPAALPYILVGMRIGLANSWATVVAAELIAASSGLGYLTQEAALYFRIEVIFVAVICIGILGLLMDRGILLAQARLTSWQERR